MFNFIFNKTSNLLYLICAILIIFFVLLIITKLIIKTAKKYEERINYKIIKCKNNITVDQAKIIFLQLFLFVISQNISIIIPINFFNFKFSFLFINLIPLLSITVIIQLFLCFSFLNKNSKAIKVWSTIRSWLYILLVIIFILEFSVISLNIYNLYFNQVQKILILPIVYVLSFYFAIRFFEKDLMLINLLFKKTYSILINKTNNNYKFNKYINGKALKSELSKLKQVNNLWNFSSRNKLVKQIQKINSQIKLLYINFLNSFKKTILNSFITKQKIIVNGWLLKHLK